ncbi:MAG: DUF362 domain-containing protein [Candidatus Saganbacteria bacterium]|nr:DUF362 domain-containing protein [Candidatus Saganbacteria bacterium]
MLYKLTNRIEKDIKYGDKPFKLQKRFEHIDPSPGGAINFKEWSRVARTFKYDRPDFYAFRPREAKVVIRDVNSNDKAAYRDTVAKTLDTAGLFDALRESQKRSGLPKDEYIVGIKPNWMMALTKNESDVWTKPELVEAIVDVLLDRGYENILIIESDNMYGNFVERHTVLPVLEDIVGVDLTKYEKQGVTIVNLTSEAKHVGVFLMNTRKMGKYPIAPSLKFINFLINVPKFKTHPSSLATLSFKNMHGANYFGDKFNYLHGNSIFDLFRYHARFWFDPTFELNVNPELEYTKDMFTIVDAETGLDGFGGWKSMNLYAFGKPITSPFTGETLRWSTRRTPGKIIASRDPLKLEIISMLLMNYNVKQLMQNPFIKSMVNVVSGLPSLIEIDDNGKNELKPFEFNTSGNFEAIFKSLFGKPGEKLSYESRLLASTIIKLFTFGEGLYPIANLIGWSFSGTDPAFNLKPWKNYKGEIVESSKKWLNRNLEDKKSIKTSGIENFIFGKGTFSKILE